MVARWANQGPSRKSMQYLKNPKKTLDTLQRVPYDDPTAANNAVFKKPKQKNLMTTPATKPTPEIINDDQLNKNIKELLAEGLNSRQIGERLGVVDWKIRNTSAWRAASQNGTRKSLAKTKSGGEERKPVQNKKRRRYGSITVPRTKAGLLKHLKAAGNGLCDELRKSPNSYQCNYFVIREHAEVICRLLEKVVADE